MEQGIYIDVLLATNYIINMMLIACVGKISGRSPKRRRIVAAALLGAVSSLTIFLPSMGFFISILIKLTISSGIVLAAFPFTSTKGFFKQLFLFFAVSFTFAGFMLGIWLIFTPKSMIYYNGVVYFDISSFLLIITTVVAYVGISLAQRMARGKSPENTLHMVTLYINGASVTLGGLVDTGNHLTEPFSGSPVIVCEAEKLHGILPEEFISAVIRGDIYNSQIYGAQMRVRMIPYSNVGGSGVMPAVKADYISIESKTEKMRIEQVYVALSQNKIGDESYSLLLNPELVGIESKTNTKKVAPIK